MASGTVGYTDTRGNKDYSSIIANQIGRRLTEASNMAASERAFAAEQAEAGGTSLQEAGIGRGYFFGRALGSRFGGDRIARTRGRMGFGGAGTNPRSTPAQRFRGGFDYNVTNQTITDVAPLSNALAIGLRGVQEGLTDVAGAIQRQGTVLNKLSQNQADMAKATMFNGYLFAMFQSQQKQAQGRASLAREEKSIEGRGGFGGRGRIGGASFGGAGGGRGMINVTPGGAGRSGGSGGGLSAISSLGSLGLASFSRSRTAGKLTGLARTGLTGAKTGIYGGDVLKAASYVQQGLNPAKVSANVAKLIGDPSSRSVWSKLLSGGDEAVDTAEMVAKSAGAVSATTTGVKQLDFMMSMQAAGKADLADEMLDASARVRGLKDGTSADSLIDADIFNALRDKKGRKMYSRKQVEIFKELGLSPGKENYARYMNRTRIGLPSSRPKTMRAAGFSEMGIAEAIKKYYPNVKFKNLEEAVVLTDFARRLEMGEAAPDAINGIRKAFGSEIADNVFIKGAKTAAKNSMVGKALGKAGGKSALKKIPLIGAVLGTAFAIDRLRKGDFLGAGLEFSSGMLGLVPGLGTGLGFGIDGFLLARDMGMTPMAQGGIVKGMRGKGLPMMLGAGLPSLVGEGGSDEAVLPLNKKTFTSFGMGVMDAMQLKKADFVKNLGMGVFSGIGSARSGGLFDGLATGLGETISNVKNNVSNVLQKINPANLFKPNASGQNFFQRMTSGVSNWWNKGMKPNESKMSWKDLISDDWAQRQRTQGAGKGSWNPFRGMPGYGSVKNFLTGKPGNEIPGGFQTGPTPLIRQSVMRGLGLLTNPKAAIMAALMKPTALADGTMDAYMNSNVANIGDTMNLTTPLGSGQVVTPTIINNNYYNSSGGQVGSGEDASVPFASLGMDAFMVNYSLSTK